MLTNNNNIDLAMAVFLATDFYDGIVADNAISVTTLLKPTKAIILAKRVQGIMEADIASKIPSAFGTALHDAIEKAWLHEPQEAMRMLGYPERVVEGVRVNPTTEDEDAIDVFLEQRVSKEFRGFLINGKYDMIMDGKIHDYKTTGTYTWIKDTNKDKYIKQASLYRWLNPEKISNHEVRINFIFTDWSKLGYIKSPKTYPAMRIMHRDYKLDSIQDTERWVIAKLKEIADLHDADEGDMPRCTPADLWQGDPVYKYYKDANNRKRSNGNFSSPMEAERKRRESGGMGVVIPVYDTPKACLYCDAITACKQAQSYIASGQLKVE